ncbi:hypothetical protein [Roseateles sp.]|uniref:hypothetical protein n=1 Tax=Roseateles sp. TaxID=1971397 RepID=UPI00286B446A|nr:hypothetical protein [Roseateles sp.]
MTRHTKNIDAFVAASVSSSDHIVKAYLGLVAVELILKNDVGLKGHNVPAAIDKFAHLFAIGHHQGCKIKLNALVAQLRNAITAITVQGKDGNPCNAPVDSYPNIRYVRHESDSWPAPFTSEEQAKVLSAKVLEIRAYLKNKFGKAL